MVCAGVVKRALLLTLVSLSLWSCVLEAVLDARNLYTVVQFLRTTYAVSGQFTIVVVLPLDVCTNPNANNLRQYITARPADVHAAFNNNRVYSAGRMVATQPHSQEHTEYVLLHYNHLGRLHQQYHDQCFVWYSLASPCLRTCLNPTSPFNMINPLNNEFNQWPENYRALAFNNIFHYDRETAPNLLNQAFRRILNTRLHRCALGRCFYCFNNTVAEINNTCLHQQLSQTAQSLAV